MIIVPNNDSLMINREQLVIQLCDKMMAQQPINISLNNEGPCAKSLGLYDLLDQLCERFKYPKRLITINTCNLIESHSEYNVVIMPATIYLESAKAHATRLPCAQKTFDSNFRHFGNFIGHGNINRLHIASYLYQKHASQTLQTYHYRLGSEYHRQFVGIEDMLFLSYDSDEIDQAYNFLKKCPMVLDQIDSYPILNPTTLNITKVYPHFFVEIVNLTYFSGDTFYLDEKIWRPIIMKTPFLIQGPRNFIQNFKRLGFQTFDPWWDEGYSQDPEKSQISGILQNVDTLSRLSLHDMQKMYSSMQPVLDHNFEFIMKFNFDR